MSACIRKQCFHSDTQLLLIVVAFFFLFLEQFGIRTKFKKKKKKAYVTMPCKWKVLRWMFALE